MIARLRGVSRGCYLACLFGFGVLLASCATARAPSYQLELPPYATIEALHQTDQIRADHKYIIRKSLPQATSLVVLVHGWMGDQSTTWGHLPKILGGGAGDSGALEWTRRFNVMLYGYPTLAGERELAQQARILLTEIQLARQRCHCDRIYLVGHSLGGLLITRAIVSVLLKDAPSADEESMLESLTATVLLAPAFQLMPHTAILGRYISNKHIADMGDFSEFRRSLEDDLERLRRERPDRYTRVFSQRSAFILAEDDSIVDNEATRSLFPDSRHFDLPGTHVSLVKVDAPTNETFLALGEVLQRTSPIQLVQLPQKREARLDLDKVQVSPKDVYFADDSIMTKLFLTTRDREIKEVETSVTPSGYGFYSETLQPISSMRAHDWVIRILREPTAVTTARSHTLNIFVNGKLIRSLPIVAQQTNIKAFEKIVREHEPTMEGKPPHRRVRGWGERDQKTGELVDALLNSQLEERVARGQYLAQAFLEYVAGDTTLIPLRVDPRRTRDRVDPLVLKWEGIAAFLSGDSIAAMEAFRRLSAVSPIGDAYLAFTLCVMGRAAEARAILAATPQPLRSAEGFAEDVERVFGETAVQVLLRSRE